MDTTQISRSLRKVKSFLGVFPSDLLPHSVRQSCTVIINADPNTKKGSHLLAIHFRPKYSSSYYFDTYGTVLLVSDNQAFIRRNCTVADYNKRQLQGLTSNVCGKYCYLFALYMEQGYTPQQFVGLFDARDADAERVFEFELGPLLPPMLRGRGQCSSSFI